MANRASRKGGAVGALDAKALDASVKSGTPGSGSTDKTAGLSRGWVLPPPVTKFDSGFGYTFLAPQQGNVAYADRLQAIVRVLRSTALGYMINGAPTVSGTHSVITQYWQDVYPMLVMKAEQTQGYRHTPTVLTDLNILRHYVDHWTTAVMNCGMLLNLGKVAGYNDPSIELRQNVAPVLRRATQAWAILASLPMPRLFRDYAVLRSSVRIPIPGGPICFDIFNARPNNWGTNNAKDWTAVPEPTAANLDLVMDDVEYCIAEITGRSSDANDNSDYQYVRTLLNFLGVERGLPEPPGLTQSPYLYDEMFRGCYTCIDTKGVGADVVQSFPVKYDDSELLRRGRGPITPYVYGGMAMAYAASTSNGAVDGARVQYGTIHHWVDDAAQDPGQHMEYECYNAEDGWFNMKNKLDYGDAASLVEHISDCPLFVIHEKWPTAVWAQAASPERRTPNDLVDWEFMESVNQIGEIYRVMVSQAFGVPAL